MTHSFWPAWMIVLVGVAGCGGLLSTDDAGIDAGQSHDGSGISDATHTDDAPGAADGPMDSSVPMDSSSVESGCSTCPSPSGPCGGSNVCPPGETCVTWWVGTPYAYADECYPLCGCTLTSPDLCACVAACACPHGDSCKLLEPGAGVYCEAP